eukprot:762982-Hanusia_phi.AAC.6
MGVVLIKILGHKRGGSGMFRWGDAMVDYKATVPTSWHNVSRWGGVGGIPSPWKQGCFVGYTGGRVPMKTLEPPSREGPVADRGLPPPS